MGRAAGRILIVDDEPPLLKMMSVYLGRLGYTVVTAGSTEQARAQVQTAPAAFAAVVIDATMAGSSMEDLALGLLRANPALCVLATSGYPVDMAALRSAAPGRADFLHKPFSPEMLESALRRLLAAQKEEL